MKIIRVISTIFITVLMSLCLAQKAWGFCGFYVAKADTKLYNQSSQVVIARDGDRTVLTMANDYQGDVKDFAMVVPVPVVLQREQVNVGDPKIIERLDQFSAPRLVEYFDPDPCAHNRRYLESAPADLGRPGGTRGPDAYDRSLGVTVEERFSVGEYNILILSAKDSRGLETWLRRNGYKIPRGANRLLRPYIRQNMKFFVAKVNLEEFDKTAYQRLRPLQMAYESPRFMLPIRLGMMNATGEQDLIVYVLSPRGQAEITNYRTVKIPSNTEIPVFVKAEFGDFYTAMFQTAYEGEGKKVAFLEYAWDMASCDPCSANPLNWEELRKSGVFWLNSGRSNNVSLRSNNVYITRLHVRYTRDTFPEDLMFQETSNRELFQGRYILRHPFTGEMSCRAGVDYQQSLNRRLQQEAKTLAELTGWDIDEIRNKIDFPDVKPIPWWRHLW
ncbi:MULTISPECIES: DUF2330 domain-containing protein [unclassified Moorena]|uniref:DUF2330 domain-containing protein n=1 Tax=unclassified Moorena TaxID=2683338 RepID=UPI0014005920|nr:MULTISPECIES: DUF2330 domain-containing protein [unclassified Moorena]NEO16366.1 DUF2330 domain-containing protein [Moorena sp. SIO3E8]NEQ02915.1 DUF2330 domain-containing protein [Moorena sp. SIO3F7]